MVVTHRRSLDWQSDLALNIANWEEADDHRPRAREALAALYMQRAQAPRRTATEHQMDLARSREQLDLLQKIDPSNAAAPGLTQKLATLEQIYK